MFVVLIQSRLGLRDAFFVNGDNNVRTVRMSYELTERLEKEGNAEAEQGTEQAAEECQQDTLLLRRMRRFLHEDADK